MLSTQHWKNLSSSCELRTKLRSAFQTPERLLVSASAFQLQMTETEHVMH